MARYKQHVGSVYRRKTSLSSRLYLSVPDAVAEALAIPRSIATGLTDTPQNRLRAKDLLVQITEQYQALKVRQKTSNSVNLEPVVNSPTRMSIKAAFDAFKMQYAVNRTRASQRNYTLAYNAIMSHGDEMRAISETDERQHSYLEGVMLSFVRTGRSMHGGALKSSTVEDYIRTFMIFLTWAADESMMPVTVRRKHVRAHMKPVQGKEIRIYTDDEIVRLIETGRASKRTALKRMADLVQLLARTPLRLHEALEMTPSWIDRNTLTLRVARKDGKKTEYVPLRQEDIDVIDAICRRNKAGMSDPVLGYRMTSDSRLRRTLYDLMTEAHVERNGRSFHEFKKTYITRLVTMVGTHLSMWDVARLARCSEQVIRRHYLVLGTDHLRTLMQGVWAGASVWQSA